MKFNTKIIFMEKYTKNNSAEQEKASTTNLRIFGLGLVAVIVLGIFFDPSFINNLSDPVKNSGLDASVYQVEQFLYDNLKDPDSYDPIEWSAVQKTKNGYYVRHKYRARNGFGGMNIENKIFYLDEDGNVTRYTDYDDASVYQQVEQFLDDHLKYPDSYESIEWSPVQKTENGYYYVRHKYRARNGFGEMKIENKIFYLDENGNVIRYTDYDY